MVYRTETVCGAAFLFSIFLFPVSTWYFPFNCAVHRSYCMRFILFRPYFVDEWKEFTLTSKDILLFLFNFKTHRSLNHNNNVPLSRYFVFCCWFPRKIKTNHPPWNIFHLLLIFVFAIFIIFVSFVLAICYWLHLYSWMNHMVVVNGIW